jgi:hypothetical protein
VSLAKLSCSYAETSWECRQKIKSVPAESWGIFVGNCFPHLIAVCVLYTEIKISALFK